MTISACLHPLSHSKNSAVKPLKRLLRWIRGPRPQERIDPFEVNRVAHLLNQYTKELNRVSEVVKREHDEIMGRPR